MEIVNKEVFENFLNEVLKENVIHDIDIWIEDVYNSICNGNYDFEVRKNYTKSGLPECIRFDYTIEIDENENEYIKIIF